MTNMICNECETVAHCTSHGCIPKQTAVDRLLDEAKLLADDRPVEVGNLPEWTLNAEHTIRRLVKALALGNEVDQEQPAQQQEPVAWRNAALRIGEDLSSVGPDGYYDMTASQWLDWAMAQEPRGKTSPPAQRKPWVGLTDKEIDDIYRTTSIGSNNLVRAIEAKLKEKNT